MFCPKCGNEIKEGQKFCTKCGMQAPDLKQMKATGKAPAPPKPTGPPTTVDVKNIFITLEFFSIF
jgi:hypothetical protein